MVVTTAYTPADTRVRGGANFPLLNYLSGFVGGKRGQDQGENFESRRNVGGTARRARDASCPSSVSVAEPSTQRDHLEKHKNVMKDQSNEAKPSFGYARVGLLRDRFEVLQEIARGGNGIIRLIRDKNTLHMYAMKCIPKVLDDPSVSERKKLDHAGAIQREVDVMRRLRGCLNVASLEDVYEDEDTVYIVMEYCTGGELVHVIGEAHYTEQTVASFLRATLRTLAQCHSNGILHRDIKPGNFLLASEEKDAPLKAIDFGLAAFVNDGEEPATDLSLEGTPWFMAPETLQNEVYKSSDIWAAGVMAYQLLTGKFPFNDKKNPYNPSLSQVWKSVLSDPLNMSDSRWHGVSAEAKDFVSWMLNKDPMQRPTATEALKHPWLKGTIKDRHRGTPLSLAVVQRIQRFSQASVFKKTVLEMIAEELMNEDGFNQGQALVMSEDGNLACPLGEGARPLIVHPGASPLEYLYAKLKLVDKSIVDRKELAKGLTEMGYKLTDNEVDRLLDQLDSNQSGHIAKSLFAASQIDWEALKLSNMQRWIDRAGKVFAALDEDGDGVLSSAEITALLASKLPPGEVEGALRHVIAEAQMKKRKASAIARSSNGEGAIDEDELLEGKACRSESLQIPEELQKERSLHDGLNFRQFLRLLSPRSMDSLDNYEDRLGSPLVNSSMHSMDSKSSMKDVTVHDIDRLIERSISVHNGQSLA
jgi:calcium-dependent protein kinase